MQHPFQIPLNHLIFIYFHRRQDFRINTLKFIQHTDFPRLNSCKRIKNTGNTSNYFANSLPTVWYFFKNRLSIMTSRHGNYHGCDKTEVSLWICQAFVFLLNFLKWRRRCRRFSKRNNRFLSANENSTKRKPQLK